MTAGEILGKAASVFHDFKAVQTQSYGPEARGGAARSEVIISDREIGYCGLTETQYMMVMSQSAFDKYNFDLTDDAVVVLDPDLVPYAEYEGAYKVPATRIAEEMGNKIVANIVMLGAFNAAADLVPQEALEEAVKDSVPSRFLDLNLNALREGVKCIRSGE